MQDERKYLIEIPGMEGSDVWDADRWERNKDKLLNDHSDVNVFELGAYDPEDEQEGDQFLISMEGMDGGDLWDADRWNRNKERFLAENPTATVNRVRYVDYWGDKADENRAKRSELMQPDEARNAKLAELGYYDDITGGQVDFDINAPSSIGLKPLSSAVKENSVSGATEYLDPRVQEFFANDSAYTERQAEIARLDAEYEQNPAVIRYREWQAQQAEEQARYAEDLKQRIKADLEENVDPAKAAEGERAKYAHYGMQGRYLADIEDIEENAKKERYATALKFLEKAEFAREHAGKGTVSGVAIGAKGAAQQFGAGIGEFAHGKALDAVTQGDIEAYNEIGDILTGLEERLGSVKAENITPEILEEYLTKDEQALILAFYEYNRAMAEAQQDMSKWYKGGKIFAESVPFMLEFLATGGIFEAASGGASKLAAKGMTGALAKWLAKSGAKTAGKAVLKAGKALAGAAAGTLARTIASPGTYKRMAEASVEVDDQGHLHRGANAARAAADMYIENLSEISGGLIGKTLGYVGSGVGKAASWAFSKTPFAKYGTMLANNQLMQTIGAGIKSFMPKLEALGFHGLPEEIGEEFIGNAIRDLSGLQPGAFREMFEDDNFGSMLIGFAPMTLIGAAGGVANVAIVNAQAASLGKDLRDMFSHAYDKEHVDHMMSSLDTAETPEQMQQAVKPLVSSVISAMESGMITQEQGEFEIESIYQYAGLVAQNKALLFGKKDQDRQLADAKKAELEQEYGTFWQDREGKQDVQVAKLDNGSTVFVVSTPEADGKIMTVDTQTGQKGFANTADIATEEVEGESVQNSRTMSLDQFLNTRIALERQTAEQNRMLRETQEQIDALRSEIRPGTKINLGTEGSPVILFATGSNNAGVVVMDQNGAQSTLSWEQAADALGKPIIVKTDAQISDALVAEKAAELAERRKARANASLAAVAAEQAATEVTEAAVAENRHIPMKEDGTVNEAAFWEQDPEGYVAWNDEQNQDGGQDSLQQIAIAKMELTRLLDEQTAAQNTSNPEIRKAAKAEATRLAERIAQLDAIEQSYAQALEEEIQAVQETQATPTAEMSEQDLEQMDTQYQNIFGKTKVRAERVRIMQEYLDKLSEGSTPNRVLTKENYREVMAEAGCTEGAIKRVEEAIKKGRGVAGFASAGTAFVVADTIKSIEEARITYIHERQHILNSGNRQHIKDMAEALGSRENALVILENLVGSIAIEEYENDSLDQLADEIICRSMEIAYTAEDFSVALQEKGVSQEVIDVINNIDNGQNTTQSNLAARRRSGRDSYADRSGRENHSENGRNSEQVSGGLLGQEETGSLGSRGRGDGSRGSGEPGAEVSSDETPFRITAEEDAAYMEAIKAGDLPEANLSDETKAELAEKDLVMEGGAIMSTEYAALKHETGYQTPIERNTDADGVRFSVATMPAWKEHYMSQEEAERRVVQYLESFVERVTANELVNGVVSHGKHRYGKKESGSFAGPLRTNVEYIVTFDLDTSCPRTFQYLNFVKVIERRIGRPLTQIESIQLTEIMRMYGQQIPCVYCYSENKRQALKQYYTDYMTSRHAVISAKTEEAALAAMYGHEDGKKGESDDPKVALTPAAYKVFKNWRSNPKGTYNPTLRMLWRQYSSDRNSVLTLLDSRAASGVINVDQSDELIAKKIGTELGVSSPRALKVIEEIVAEWKWNTIESKAHDDFTPVDEDDIWVNEKALDLWRDMTSYAKSASSAKGVLRYTPYTDELKKLSQEDRDYINGMGGVRMHSSNDFRIDYVIDYFQFMADMALYKMFGHTYTKSPEFVRIFGNSGYKINMSIAAYQDENGNIRPNVDEGFDWNEAKELRRLFPNAGTMLMATSDEQLQMALDSDWIDMCIPFHRSGLPKAVWYNMRLWTDYENKQKELFYNTTEMTEQLVADGVEIPAKAKPEDIEKLYLEHFNIEVAYNKKGERIKPHFLPGPTKVDDVDIPGHNDDHQRYLDLCKKWGVKPRFQGIKVKDNTPEGNGRIVDITEHPRYMIFVKETARTDTPQTPVQFNFDQPSEALGGKTPMEYAFDELEARAMAESELAGGKVNDIYNSLNQDQFGIIDQFISTVIRHKEETGEDYPLDYITPEARDWFLVQRKALEEAFQGVESIPYHRNEYDELGNLVEGVGLENARREEEERIAAEEKAAKEAAKAAKAAARKAAAAARKAAAEAKKAAKETKTPVDLVEEAKKALEDEVMMRFIGEEGAARLDAAIEASVYMDNLNVARSMEATGKDARAIKAATGWERGADNKWRYEQEDFEFKAKPGKKKTFKLSDLIHDIMLFEAYPQLRDIKVQYAKLSKGSAGEVAVDKDGNRMIRISSELYRAQNPVIVKAIKEFTAQYPDVVMRINAGRGTEEDKKILRDNLGAVMTLNEKYVDELGGKDTLAHEIQHLIQEYEGFAQGGNASQIDTTDPKVRAEVERVRRIQEAERKLIEDYIDKAKAIFGRGKLAELGGNRAEAVRLRAEYDKLIRQIRMHERNYLALQKSLSDTYAKLGDEGYARLAGEVEARNVEKRMDMTDEQRRLSLIEDTQDVAKEDQIFILDNLMMNYDEMADVSFRITPEEDAEYMKAVETGDLEKAQQMVDEAARKAGYTQKVYRVDEYEGDRDRYKGVRGGVYYAESLDYFDHSDTGYHREDAEPFYINTDGFFDPMNEMRNLIVNAWADILGRESDFEKYGIEDESDTDRGQYNDGEEILTTSTDGLAYAAQEQGYKGVILRDIPQRGTSGAFTEYAIFDSDKVKSADAVTYDNDGNVIPLSERFQDDNEDIRFSVTGEVALYHDMTPQGRARMQDYFKAQEMNMHLRPDWNAEYDENARKIKMATGWEKGVDGLWRYEVEDIKMKPIMSWLFSREELTLGDIVEDGELLRLYPSLADIRIVKKQTLDDMNAWYNSGTKEMGLPFATVQDAYYHNGGRMFDMYASIMNDDILHEVQHAIQFIEGFADGGSSSYYGREAYNALAGEVEARNVVSRSLYTPEMRRQMLLATTEDTDRVDQGVVKPRRWRAGEIRFRMSNDNQEIFVSNAACAVEGIKQEKATPEQWLKMLEKNGGLKAGEDKWMGLSDWLKASDKKTLTKQEVLDFINEHMIIIEEQHYAEVDEQKAVKDIAVRIANGNSLEDLQEMINEHAESASRFDAENEDEDFDLDSWLMDIMVDEFGDDFATAYTIEDAYIEYADVDWWDLSNEPVEGEEGERPINETRLDYTTIGLNNRHEIALTVPTIESWNEDDALHFGDAGDGRAVAWIRFGETTDESGNKVLVIDEIQSQRHQEGREEGYRPKDFWPLRTKYLTTRTVNDSFYRDMEEKYGEAFSEAYTEEDFRKVMSESDFSQMLMLMEYFERASNDYIPYRNSVPDAPFDKNWHELAMKRMLRYAAENGYDVIAWTKGDQQAARYNIGGVISEIKATKYPRGYEVVSFGKNGSVVHNEVFADESAMAGVYGKEMAKRIIESVDALEPSETATISGDNLRVGGEGMKGFYDKILPAFMDKYGKKWGVKTTDIELPKLEEAGRVMHSVPVTEEMKESVMEGQVIFRTVEDNAGTSPEYYELVDALFNDEKGLAEKYQMRYFDIATTASFYKKIGIQGERFTIKYGTISAHFKKDKDHTMTKDAWYAIPKALNEPIFVTKYGDKANKYRIYTSIQIGERYVIVGVDVIKSNQGKDKPMIEINSIKTIFAAKRVSDQETVVCYNEKITPEQEALLDGRNFRQYPSIQELSDNKGSDKTETVNTNKKNIVEKNDDTAFRVVTDQETIDWSNEDENVSFRTVGTPTEQIVAEGVNFSKKDLASLAGEIFAALPEESRRKITDRLNGNLLGLQDAIMQIPTDLAVKEEWSEEDKEVATAIAAVMTDAAGQPMTRPFTAREALWVLYDATNKETDLVSEASRALVKRNLGFDSASLELQEILDDYVNFRTVGNDKIDAATDMYNYETSLWTERLKESWLDMNQSVESLQRAMAEGSGMEIEPWENVVLALNRLSSKSYADKKKYLRDFLTPMWDAVLAIAGNTRDGIARVERYLMLKHGLERNKIFAKRDAREYYRTMYDLVAERMQKQSQDQKNAALADAQKALADIDAQMAVAASSQLGRLNEARKKAVHDLEIATLVIRGDEQENEKELQMYYDAIDAEIDVKYHEFREKDYGGLTSMFMDVTDVKRSDFRSEEAYHKAVLANQKPKYKTVEEMEDHAKTEVFWFEKDHDTTDLWAKINAATKEVLRHQHEAGMITDEQYEAVRDMFEYYVPLRGFAENTAEDMYSYYMSNTGSGFAKPIIAAKGRKTKAESPLGWIGSMAESAIQADNKNDAKMKLYYAALRRPDLGILSLTETWFEYTGQKDDQGRKIFAPAYPPATDKALSADELRDHMNTWEEDMRQKQSRGEAYKGSQRVNLKGSVIFQDTTEEQEHVIRVKVAGKDYSILINGNPRAAQAINGLLNPEANKSVVEEWIGVARRALSSMLTSFSPLFWVANYQRDLLSSVMRVSESDGVKAAWQYFNNRRKAWRVASYVYKYDEGTMGDSYYEQMYKEFAENGGITGYTVLTTNKEYEKLLEDYAKSMGRPVAKAIKNVWEKFMGFGEAIEQVSRFAAYLTAREAGKSIEEAVNAAKEVSVNFNRKGSANPISIKELEKLRTKSGKPLNMIQKIAAIVLSAMPKWMKELYFFFNASVQAISSSVKLAKKSPGKAAAWAGMYFGMSIAMAVINNLLSGDDDDEEYLDLPDYLRHSTILIKVSDKYYLKWSLPQEMRPFYAWADIIVNKAMGKIPHKNAGVEMALAAMQWLPVNPFDSEDPLLSLTPDVAAPFAEIKLNQTSFGSKVYNDMPFISEEVANEIPDFRKATSKTGKVYVDLAEFLNDVTGGDEVTSGWIDFNPAKLEHIVEGYGGGIYDFAKMMVSLPGLLLGDEPVKVKDIPFVNKVILSVDETNMNSHTNEAFIHYKNVADNAKRVEGEYRASDKPERADAYRQEDDWRIYLLYKQYEDDFKEIKEKLDAAADQTEIDLLREQQNDLREMFLNDIANNVHADAEVQMRYDMKRYESELREFLEPVTDANKERLEMKKQRNWKAMNKARRQRDSLRRLPEYKLAESAKKDIRELKEKLSVLDTMTIPEQRDSFLSKLQIDYDEIVKKLGELNIE
jgi:hypothetical protein